MSTRIEIVPVKLGNGRTIHVEARAQGGEEDVAFEHLSFDAVSETISDIAESLAACLAKAKPKTASVEFGIEAAVESGKLTALLVKGSAKANLKITLSWSA